MEAGEFFRLQERSPPAGGSSWARNLLTPRCMCDSVAYGEAEYIVHDDLCQQHLMKSSILRRLNLAMLTGKKAIIHAALSDGEMKPKKFHRSLFVQLLI